MTLPPTWIIVALLLSGAVAYRLFLKGRLENLPPPPRGLR